MLRQVLTLWNRPSFRPLKSGRKPALVVVFNNADTALLDETRALSDAFPDLAKSFSRFEVFSAGLTGDADLYARNETESKGAFGNKAGPNFLFQKTMHAVAGYGDYTLQIELDCLPVRPGWIDEANAVVARNAGAWVIGSTYPGDVTLDRRVQFHFNGNAIYKAGDPAFRTFLDEVWIARILHHIRLNPNLAYDCWWAFEMSRANAMIKNDAWRLWQTYDPFFHNDPFLVNLTVGIDHVAQFFEIHDEIKARRAAPIFFHGKAIQTLIEKLQEAPPNQRLRQFVKEWTDGLPPASDGTAPARSAPLANAAPPPAMHLLKGFNNIEGPVERYGPTRFAWSKARQVEVLAENLNGPLSLRFRIEPKFGDGEKPLPDLKVSQGGKGVPHKLRLSDDKDFGFLDIPRKHITEDQPLVIEMTAPIHKEPGPNARDLGILFFEDKMRFYPARAMAQTR